MNRAAEPYLKLSQIVNGFASSRAVQVAIELDLFSKLANQGKTAAQLAALAGTHASSMELLLNALTALGLLRKEAERFFALPIAHTYLARSGPKYMGHWIRHQAQSWESWSQLLEAVQSGRPVKRQETLHESPRDLEVYIRGLHELAIARGDARWLARAVSLKRCRSLLDLGGGPGTYAAMFCRSNRNLRAVVVDLPATLRVTRKILRDFDLTGRVSLQSADYRKDKIKGGPYDVALVSNILHSETEETNRTLLRNVHAVLSPGALLMIKDHVMSPDHTEPEEGALFALDMLLGTRGRTYSFSEIAGWLEDAGFQDMTELPLESPSNVSLVLALRPGKRALVVLPRPAARLESPGEAATEQSAETAAESVDPHPGAQVESGPNAVQPRKGGTHRSAGATASAAKPKPRRSAKSNSAGKDKSKKDSGKSKTSRTGAGDTPRSRGSHSSSH